MKTLSSVLTRRDRCYLFGRRAARLTPDQAAEAWYSLAAELEAMGTFDVPKFADLLIAIRVVTVRAKRPPLLPSVPSVKIPLGLCDGCGLEKPTKVCDGGPNSGFAGICLCADCLQPEGTRAH